MSRDKRIININYDSNKLKREKNKRLIGELNNRLKGELNKKDKSISKKQ